MVNAKPCSTHMVSTAHLSKFQGSPMANPREYRSIVGGLQYLTITRPDISFSANKVSQFMANPLDTHWRAVKLILRYVAGTLDHGIHLVQTGRFDLIDFFDSDWASDVNDRRSTSGMCVYFGGNFVSWSAKKQHVVSRSSTETEYRSLANTAAELAWIASLFQELSVGAPKVPIIWVDNLSVISLASNMVLHAGTKHIELDVHFMRDKIAVNALQVQHVPFLDQVADIFTKS